MHGKEEVRMAGYSEASCNVGTFTDEVTESSCHQPSCPLTSKLCIYCGDTFLFYGSCQDQIYTSPAQAKGVSVREENILV